MQKYLGPRVAQVQCPSSYVWSILVALLLTFTYMPTISPNTLCISDMIK